MQRDRKQVARYWLAASRQDLRIADNYQATEPNVACFHAQQGCEKALKALLVQVAGDIARSHVAAELVDELREAGVTISREVRAAAVGLDRYYATTRYPDAMGDADPTESFFETDAQAALSAATSVLEWVVGQGHATESE